MEHYEIIINLTKIDWLLLTRKPRI